MISHADALRHMAKDHLIAGNEHTADALLAGADALETIAAQSVEYRTEAYALLDDEWFPITHWAPADTPPTSKGWNIHPVRIMARRDPTPWEVEQ